MRRGLAATAAFALLWPAGAGADEIPQILTAENAPRLCTATADGIPAVDRDVLAVAVTSAANAFAYLDGANAGGLRNEAIELKSVNGIESEPLYAIKHVEDKPFGPNVDLAKDKSASKAAAVIKDILALQLGFLMLQHKKPAGSVTYSVRPVKKTGSRTDEADQSNPLLLFGGDSPVIILCNPGDVPEPDVVQNTDQEKPLLADVVKLRGTVKDLAVPTDSLKDADAATIAYQRDGVKDVDTFKVNGVLGVSYTGDNFSATPFLSYEKESATGHLDDVEKVSPGILGAYWLDRDTFALHFGLEGAYMDDLEHDADQGKLRFYIDPAFAVAPGNTLFGAYLTPIGPFQFRPDLTLFADASYVFDRGDSEELQDAEEYFGLGGIARLQMRLLMGQPISDVTFEVGVRDLEILDGLGQDRILRWFGSVEYAPENFPYFGLKFTASKGENDDTFQEEERYEIGLSFRY